MRKGKHFGPVRLHTSGTSSSAGTGIRRLLEHPPTEKNRMLCQLFFKSWQVFVLTISGCCHRFLAQVCAELGSVSPTIVPRGTPSPQAGNPCHSINIPKDTGTRTTDKVHEAIPGPNANFHS